MSGAPRGGQRARVAAREVDGARSFELAPRQRVVAVGDVAFAHDRDRALGARVEEREGTALGRRARRRVDPDAARREPALGLAAALVVAQGGEEVHFGAHPRELDRGHSPASGRLLPALLHVRDLARARDALDDGEPHPLDVSDDG